MGAGIHPEMTVENTLQTKSKYQEERHICLSTDVILNWQDNKF